METLTPDDVISFLLFIVAALTLYFTFFHHVVRLEAFYTHTGANKIPGSAPSDPRIHTHTIVLRNSGRKTATNVHVVHEYLPEQVSVDIYPLTNLHRYSVDRGGELVIQRIGPNEQYTLFYLYPGNIFYHQLGLYVTHDDGMALSYPMQFVRVMPNLFNRAVLVFMIVGFLVCIYWLLKILVPLVWMYLISS